MEDVFMMLRTMVETLKDHNLKEISYVVDTAYGDYEVIITIKKK